MTDISLMLKALKSEFFSSPELYPSMITFRVSGSKECKIPVPILLFLSLISTGDLTASNANRLSLLSMTDSKVYNSLSMNSIIIINVGNLIIWYYVHEYQENNTMICLTHYIICVQKYEKYHFLNVFSHGFSSSMVLKFSLKEKIKYSFIFWKIMF